MKHKYFLLLLFIPLLIDAQEIEQSNFKIPKDDPNYGVFGYVEAVYHYSRYLKNTDNLSDIMSNRANTFEMKVGIQSVGKKKWQQYWAYPTYGIGFYSASFGSADTLGEPSAVYLFYGGPMKRWKRLGLFYEMSVGVSYDFVKYDPITNPQNDLIGSTVNVYLAARLYLQYKINSRLDASLGLDLAHFSNGSTRTPNMGLNIYGPNLALKYNFNPVRNYTKKIDDKYKPPLRPEFIKSEWPEKDKSNFIHLFVAAGGKTTNKQPYDGPTYFVSTIAVDYTRQYSHIARWGAGLDFFYDSSLRENSEDTQDVPFGDLIQIGAHMGNELIINKFAFITQFGYYLYSPETASYKSSWYLRFNLRYLICDQFGIQGGLKTLNGGVADFIEWGLYFRMMKK